MRHLIDCSLYDSCLNSFYRLQQSALQPSLMCLSCHINFRPFLCIHFLYNNWQLKVASNQLVLCLTFRPNTSTTKSRQETFWAPAGFESIEKSATLSDDLYWLSKTENRKNRLWDINSISWRYLNEKSHVSLKRKNYRRRNIF